MSTSLLYHGFHVQGYTYLRTEYSEGVIFFHMEKNKYKLCCACCGSRDVVKKGRKMRNVQTLPIGRKKVFLSLHLHRLKCNSCGCLKQEELLISASKKHRTYSLERYVVELLKHSTVKEVALHLGMSWNTVKEIHSQFLKKKYSRIKLRGLRYLGVDEIALRKGHRYMTVVVNLENGEVVWCHTGRSIYSLETFLKKVKRSRADIKAIAIDMWPSYLTAVLRHFPRDVVVFDHFHVIQNYNRMLERFRKKQAAKARKEDKAVYKGTRYLLLKGQEKIQANEKAREKLIRLLKLNQKLSVAYILKEELRALWNCTCKQQAMDYMSIWLQKLWASGIEELNEFAHKMAEHFYGIINYFDHGNKRVTTAIVEGINNKIKVLKRQAYGFRDVEYFKLRIYALHESRYSLIG